MSPQLNEAWLGFLTVCVLVLESMAFGAFAYMKMRNWPLFLCRLVMKSFPSSGFCCSEFWEEKGRGEGKGAHQIDYWQT